MSDVYRFPYCEEAHARSAALSYRRREAVHEALWSAGVARNVRHEDLVEVYSLVVDRGCPPERAVALMTHVPLDCPKLKVA